MGEGVFEEVVQSVDLTTLENLSRQSVDMLQRIYVAQLFVIGVVGAVVVCVILYSLIKKCY